MGFYGISGPLLSLLFSAAGAGRGTLICLLGYNDFLVCLNGFSMLLFLKWPVVPELDMVLTPAVESLVLSIFRLTFFILVVFF